MSNEPKAGMNLDPELLAAYIDQRLSPEQRAAVEAQLATDPDAYAVLAETLKALEQMPEELTASAAPNRPAPRRSWTIAAGIVAVAAALVFVVRLQPDLLQRLRGEPSGEALMAKLVDAVGDERYIEARLAAPFKHAPLRSVTRSANGAPLELPLLAVTQEIQRAYDRSPRPETQRALGVAALLSGRYDDAIAMLERAAAARPDDHEIATELSAAYLERSRTTGSADRLRALELAKREAESPSASAALLSNLAFALEASDQISDAALAWRRAIAVEQDPAWKREAELQLSRLQPK